MMDIGMFHYGLSGSGLLSTVSMAWAIAEAGEIFLYALLEYDWETWMIEMEQGNPTIPERLEVFGHGSIIGQPRILAYFGLGDSGWVVPPEDKDEIELMTFPYVRATPFQSLDFRNFLYDDHDISTDSNIAEQVISQGGMVMGSSGIFHDPYSIYHSSMFFEGLVRGYPVGEAMRYAVNKVTPSNPVRIWELFLTSGEMPNLYAKNRFERVLLGDPAYTPVEEGLPGDVNIFKIMPFRSFLAEAMIESDYIVKAGSLRVNNPDDYLAESGKPHLPIFVREIILPEGSGIEDLRFRGHYRTYRNIRPETIPWDEYYEDMPEGLEGRYPEEDYWFRNNTLLDGRILVRAYVPAVTYFQNRARVLKWGEVGIEYESPLELMLKTRNILRGRKERIEARIQNDGVQAVNGSLWIWVGDEEFSRTVEVQPGQTSLEIFEFRPDEAGQYQVKALFEGDVSVGPRYSSFRVWGPRDWSFQSMIRFIRKMVYLCRRGYCDSIGGLSGILSRTR
jgi:hypothetical protein